MAKVFNIRDITENKLVVYYPELGYMVSQQDKPSFPGIAWVKHKISNHLSKIRSLSLYFDKVFIPLSHICIADDQIMFEINNRLLAHYDFKALVDKNVIFAGAWGCDTHEGIIDHQKDFIREIDWPISPCLSSESIATLNSLPIAVRDVNVQINDLRRGILEYLELQIKPGESIIPLQISETVKCSEHKELPFVHEIFWQQLKKIQIPQEHKADVLRETNRIYFEAGETGNPGIILYHIPGSEPQLMPRIAKATGISCLVYHPEIFFSFMSIFLNRKELSLLLERKDINDFLALRNDIWHVFKAKYHELLTELELLLPYNMENIFQDRNKITQIIEKEVLYETKIDCSAAISFFVKILDMLVKYTCGGFDKTPINEAANVVKNPLVIWLKNLIVKSKQKEIYEFVKMIKKSF